MFLPKTSHPPTYFVSEVETGISGAYLLYIQEQEVLEREEFAELLRTAAKFEWSAVDALSYNTAVEAFVNNCEPRCVLAQRTSHPAAVLA